MNNVKTYTVLAGKHSVKMLIYVLLAWVLVSQYFAYMWIKTNYLSVGKLMGTVRTDAEITMSVDELVSVVAKEAVKSAKK